MSHKIKSSYEAFYFDLYVTFTFIYECIKIMLYSIYSSSTMYTITLSTSQFYDSFILFMSTPKRIAIFKQKLREHMISSSSFETTNRFKNPADHSSFLTQFVNDPSKQGKESHGQSETAGGARPSGSIWMKRRVKRRWGRAAVWNEHPERIVRANGLV